jgi:hypothetical protein
LSKVGNQLERLVRTSIVLALCANLGQNLRSLGHAGVCGMGGFLVSVPGKDRLIPLNGHVLVEVSMPDAALLERVSLQFASETSSVPAKIVKKLEGSYDALQLLIAPTTELAANTRYHVSFVDGTGTLAHLAADELPALAQLNERSSQSFAFTTRAERDDEAPTWRKAPSLGAYLYKGGDHKCTALESFNVHARLGADFEGYVFAHIEKRTAEETPLDALFLVSAESTQIGETHDFGHFSATRGTYAVTLTAVDLGGNETQAPGKPLLLWFRGR